MPIPFLHGFEFSAPFWLLALPFLWGGLYVIYRKKKPFFLNTASLHGVKRPRNWRIICIPWLQWIPVIALTGMVITLAHPRKILGDEKSVKEGVDIIIALDISGSMLARDFKPNRLTVAIEKARAFIQSRPNDRIGVVAFGGEALTLVPLTTDHEVVLRQFDQCVPGLLPDGTAIGSAIGLACDRLEAGKAQSKIIILMSDGENNAGALLPTTAMHLAASLGIRIYLIGIGTEGEALAPVAMNDQGQYIYDYVKVRIDEELMTEIAKATGGEYMRAQNETQLNQVYAKIDRMEKTIYASERKVRYQEAYYSLLFVCFLLLMFYVVFYYLILNVKE